MFFICLLIDLFCFMLKKKEETDNKNMTVVIKAKRLNK